jgi:GABA permease
LVVARRVLVVTTADAPEAEVESIVRAHAGEDAEVHVIAPASKISWLDRLTNAEDDARTDAAERAEAASEAAPGEHVEAHVGDVDPLQAIEDALRMFPADEVVVLTAPDEEANWLEAGLGEEARERFSVPVTHLVTR